MTVCPKCKGNAEYFKEVFNDGKRRREILIKCKKCNGTGEVEQTNEEWFCTLSTEEKAKWLSRNSKFMYGCGRMETTPKVMYEEDWEWWLKEIHHDN